MVVGSLPEPTSVGTSLTGLIIRAYIQYEALDNGHMACVMAVLTLKTTSFSNTGLTPAG